VVEERKGTVSVFNGPEPTIIIAQDETAETNAVAAFIKDALAAGVTPREIGVFTRAPEMLNRVGGGSFRRRGCSRIVGPF
jgi:hypothetical protein